MLNVFQPFSMSHFSFDLILSQFSGCGVSLAKQTAQRRIVGGDDAGFGSFPWQAYIRIGSSRYDLVFIELLSYFFKNVSYRFK